MLQGSSFLVRSPKSLWIGIHGHSFIQCNSSSVCSQGSTCIYWGADDYYYHESVFHSLTFSTTFSSSSNSMTVTPRRTGLPPTLTVVFSVCNRIYQWCITITYLLINIWNTKKISVPCLFNSFVTDNIQSCCWIC